MHIAAYPAVPLQASEPSHHRHRLANIPQIASVNTVLDEHFARSRIKRSHNSPMVTRHLGDLQVESQTARQVLHNIVKTDPGSSLTTHYVLRLYKAQDDVAPDTRMHAVPALVMLTVLHVKRR